MTEVIALAGKLDIRAVGPLHELLGGHLSGDVTLDMGQVTHVGALCLQTLIAAARAVRATGHQLAFVNVSAALEAQFLTMGATPALISEGAP